MILNAEVQALRFRTKQFVAAFPACHWRLDIRCAIQALFGLRRQSGAPTALWFRSRTKALDELFLTIQSKAASRAGPPSLACRRSPKDASASGTSFVGPTYRLDTKRVFDVVTLGARASRSPRSGQGPAVAFGRDCGRDVLTPRVASSLQEMSNLQCGLGATGKSAPLADKNVWPTQTACQRPLANLGIHKNFFPAAAGIV
jgi:hypothetical protein